jgi:hypothetical protein
MMRMSGENWAVPIGSGLTATATAVIGMLAIPKPNTLAVVGCAIVLVIGIGLTGYGALSALRSAKPIGVSVRRVEATRPTPPANQGVTRRDGNIVVREAIMSLKDTYPDIDCSIGSKPDTGIINGVRVGSTRSVLDPQFQLAVQRAVTRTGIAVPQIVFGDTGF